MLNIFKQAAAQELYLNTVYIYISLFYLTFNLTRECLKICSLLPETTGKTGRIEWLEENILGVRSLTLSCLYGKHKAGANSLLAQLSIKIGNRGNS